VKVDAALKDKLSVDKGCNVPSLLPSTRLNPYIAKIGKVLLEGVFRNYQGRLVRAKQTVLAADLDPTTLEKEYLYLK
jgi:hypothetical protein